MHYTSYFPSKLPLNTMIGNHDCEINQSYKNLIHTLYHLWVWQRHSQNEDSQTLTLTTEPESLRQICDKSHG